MSRPPGSTTATWDWATLRAASAREARRVVRSADDAEEITQEAIIRAWRRREACRAPDDPLPWVLKITRMEAYRHLERRATRLAHEGAEICEPLVLHSTPCHSDSLIRRLSLAGAMAVLNADERALITARYVDDLTQPAVAEKLGMPEGTAKVRLHRARLRLRAVLEDSV